MSMYQEGQNRWLGVVIVVVAALVFGVIICVSVVFSGALCPTININCGSGGATASGTPTPAAPAGAVEVSFYTSNTKEDWVNAATEKFNASGAKTAAGKPIFVRVTHVTSGGSQSDILSGKIKPTVWSPGDQSWVDGANQVWQDRTGQPLVSEACRPTVYAPIGFAMWRPFAEALGWPDQPITWQTLVDLAADPQGWAKYGHPEWGEFKFGHTHPDYSNAGLLIMTALVNDTLGQTGGLTPANVKSQAVIDAFTKVEQHTYHYGVQTRDLIALMARRGPSYLHASTASEAEVLKANAERASELRFPLVFIFPAKGTFWTEQPYCVVDADWVTDEQREAARIYRDFLLAREQQELAVDKYLRPVDPGVPLRAPLALEAGTDPRVTPAQVPALESPSGDAAAAVKDVFHQTKKKATIILVVDTSGSMQGEKITNAVEATANFIQRLEKDDQIIVMPFSDGVNEIELSGRAGDVAERLGERVRGLFAEGGTALFDAVCAAADRINTVRAADQAAGQNRLYGIVVLSDGQDTASSGTESDMFNCLPSGEDVQGIKVFTIAYGDDADKDLLLRVANRTNGKTFTGDPATIERVYTAISAEQ
ncbi:MAG: VWA domain-containing protein [Anaerolineales bacterium]|nr:VWA domain-containing protein [Anaerolineales bacterium]